MTASAGRSAEAQMLLSCARSRMDDASAAGARAALARGIQWEQVLRTAELQGVTPLLQANLGRLLPGQIPSPHDERLRQACRRVARLNLSLVAELRSLLQRFEGCGIPAIPFKGPVLAASAYGNLTLRRFSDLDILVRERDGDAARRLLAGLGYVVGHHARGEEYHFVDEARHITVDLHQRMASSYFPAAPDFDVLWDRSRPVSLGGWMVRSLAPEDTAFSLCVHLAKDYCTWKERLSQVCDLAELMAAEPALPWDRVLDHARATGGERIVLLALWLTRELLGSSLPDAAAAPLDRDPKVPPLGTVVRERLLRQLDGSLEYLPYRSQAPVEDFSLHLAIRERRGDRIRLVRDFILNQVERLVTPTEFDHRFLPLPGVLSPLYYLIRPIRVVRDRLRRVPRGPRRSSILLHSRRTPSSHSRT